ncbi:hypothetical protein EPUL_004836 [Erysiphe pulchra]|uniref:Lysophospholipase n=1 Tax=Erysiphe pulchra TaxID=225359 RepID=A0A2S4PMJ2_9PEZI|nr:hypothetical protein EPUL_004836 [Erysiphe pulchra]
MKEICILLTAATLYLCEGFKLSLKNVQPEITSDEAHSYPKLALKRAVAISSGSYAPTVIPCPSIRPTIRKADNISPAEALWLKLRREQTIQPMIDWLSRASIPDFDATSYIESVQKSPGNLPNIGIAFSGGGYRAMTCGAGFLAAADVRTNGSTSPGHIGGLLQASTYVAGLSGGGWLVSSVFMNNFATIQSLRDSGENSNIWKLQNSILEGPDIKGRLFERASYFKKILKDVNSKKDAGFNVSATDFWGRALSFQLIDAVDGGPELTFSSIASQDRFKDGSSPFPIIVAIRNLPDDRQNSINSNVFEMNPFELGTWDTEISGFVPMEYLGSDFTAGAIPPKGSCVKGFDQVGFLIGTTSTLFEKAINVAANLKTLSFIRQRILKLSEGTNDVAQFQPNPFLGFNPSANPILKSKELPLVDGGLDGQNLPLLPLLQESRKVDVIFAVDSSADSQNFPNGSSLVATYERSLKGKSTAGFSFPSIPDHNTFVNLGLNKRPTFFGCDVLNITGDAPMIVYIPNSKYSAASNLSTFQRQYSETLRNQIIQNGYEFSTQANGTVDPQWPACMGCAALSRSMTRTKTPVPTACQECFSRYCWDGTLNQSPVLADVPNPNPTPQYVVIPNIFAITQGFIIKFLDESMIPSNHLFLYVIGIL